MWGPMMHGGWDLGAGAGWWMLGMGLWNLLFWGAIILVAVWAIKRLSPGAAAQGPDPMQIARERYARGDITREQLDEIRQALATR